jgi:hypothetical protein
MFLILVNRQPSYPKHVLHPEIIPALNSVSADLKKRRHIRFDDPSVMETFETEMPIEIASSLQDELQRAVQNRLDELFFLHT